MTVSVYNLLYYLYTSLSFIKILSRYNIYSKICDLQVCSLVTVHRVNAKGLPRVCPLHKKGLYMAKGCVHWVLMSLLRTWNPTFSAQMAAGPLPGPCFVLFSTSLSQAHNPKPHRCSSGRSSLQRRTELAHTHWVSKHVDARFLYGLGTEPCWGSISSPVPGPTDITDGPVP